MVLTPATPDERRGSRGSDDSDLSPNTIVLEEATDSLLPTPTTPLDPNLLSKRSLMSPSPPTTPPPRPSHYRVRGVAPPGAFHCEHEELNTNLFLAALIALILFPFFHLFSWGWEFGFQCPRRTNGRGGPGSLVLDKWMKRGWWQGLVPSVPFITYTSIVAYVMCGRIRSEVDFSEVCLTIWWALAGCFMYAFEKGIASRHMEGITRFFEHRLMVRVLRATGQEVLAHRCERSDYDEVLGNGSAFKLAVDGDVECTANDYMHKYTRKPPILFMQSACVTRSKNLLVRVQEDVFQELSYTAAFAHRLTRVDALMLSMRVPTSSTILQMRRLYASSRRHDDVSNFQRGLEELMLPEYMSLMHESSIHGYFYVSAVAIADQLLIGWPMEPGLAKFGLSAIRAFCWVTGVFILLLAALAPAALRWWKSGHEEPFYLWKYGPQHAGTLWIEIVYVLFACFFGGLGMSLERVMRCQDIFARMMRNIRAMNRSFQGDEAASQILAPVVRVGNLDDLTAWSELHGLIWAKMSASVQKTEIRLGTITVTMIGLLGCVFYYAVHGPDWEIGVLSVYSLLYLLFVLFAVVPTLLTGLLVNLESRKTLSLLTEYSVQCEAFAAFSERESLERPDETQEMLPSAEVARTTASFARALAMSSQLNTRRRISILGMQLEGKTFASFASLASTGLGFAIRNMPWESISQRF